LQALFISVYSRKFISGDLHTQHIPNTCFIKATLFYNILKRFKRFRHHANRNYISASVL